MTRLLLITIALLTLLPAVGCSTVKTGKDIAIDNPLAESRKNQSLGEARKEVEQSRRLLDECIKTNGGDETKCATQKANYDKDVEEYVSLQTD